MTNIGSRLAYRLTHCVIDVSHKAGASEQSPPRESTDSLGGVEEQSPRINPTGFILGDRMGLQVSRAPARAPLPGVANPERLPCRVAYRGSLLEPLQ